MRVSLIHPSRSRPDKAKSTYDYWMSRAAAPENIEHVLSLDYSDPLRNEYPYFGTNSIGIVSHNNCVVQATNAAAEVTTGDILIYLSDDFLCPEGWDAEILEWFAPLSLPCLLKVHDNLQPFEKDVLTIPIMNRALYERLGYFWHREYRSMFVDQDLYHVCKNNDWLMSARNLIFEHEHYSVGKAPKDATYMRSDANWVSGQATYMKRKMEGFKI